MLDHPLWKLAGRAGGDVGPGDALGQGEGHGRRPVDDKAQPLLLDGRDVLDQSAEAQLAGGRGGGGLLVGEPLHSAAQGGAGGGEFGEQVRGF